MVAIAEYLTKEGIADDSRVKISMDVTNLD